MTGSTHTNNRSARSPGPKPEGPNPIAGPQTGTTRSEPSALASAGASGRHKEPDSRPASTWPAQPPSKAGGDSPRGGGRHHSDWKADRSTESDRTGRGARGMRPATTTARGQVPSHNSHRVPRTLGARTTHNEPRHRRRCQGQPGPRARTPHPRAVGSGHWPHARKDERAGVGERPSPDAQHPGKRRPPWLPSCRPDSAQGQLTRARAVGLVTVLHARIPRTHRQWVVVPGRTPESTSGRGWESARPQTPHTQAKGAPPGHSHAAPTARKASSQERALWSS